MTTDKKNYATGESAILTVRNVKPTNGNTYPFYIQITSPIRAMLRFDTYVVSDQFTGATQTALPAVQEASPVITNSTSTVDRVEIIVPKYEAPAEGEEVKASAENDTK